MLGKIIIGIGILLMLISILMAFGGIFGSFQAMEAKESAGIGGVVQGLWISIIGILALPAGAIFILIGGFKIYLDSKKKQQN